MARIRLSTLFLCWVVVLIVELLSVYDLTNRGHGAEDFYFAMLLIVVTLVVGAVALIVKAIKR